MKIKDVIERLKQFDPDADFNICSQFTDDEKLYSIYGTIGAIEDRSEDDPEDTKAYVHVICNEMTEG